MSNILVDTAPLQEYSNQQNGDKIFYSDQTVGDDSWRDLLVESGEEKTKEAMSLDLNTLLRVLDEHNNAKDGEDNSLCHSIFLLASDSFPPASQWLDSPIVKCRLARM